MFQKVTKQSLKSNLTSRSSTESLFSLVWSENSNSFTIWQQDAAKQNSKNWIFLWSRRSQKRRTNRFFFHCRGQWCKTQQRIHDLNFTLRHHENYVIKGQFVCVSTVYADFELLGKLFQAHNIVTSSSFLSIILQHTVCQNQPKKSHF